MYQAQGNLEQAAKLLSEITVQTPYEFIFLIKVTQLRLERNYTEAVRLLQARQTQFHFASEIEKGINQVWLALLQHLAGDAAGAKAIAEQARDTLEPLHKDQQDNALFAANLSLNYAVLGNKELALKEAERAVTLLPSAKDLMTGPALEENLALIQTIFGENSRANSTLTRLLQTPYGSLLYETPVTPALLRLDPLWDRLRADPDFQKLISEPEQQRFTSNLQWRRRNFWLSLARHFVKVRKVQNLAENKKDGLLWPRPQMIRRAYALLRLRSSCSPSVF
jgi:tetratricopeptide (TPR) repeat protein